MTQLHSAIQFELEAIQTVRTRLRSKIGEACLEQRARFRELSSQLDSVSLAMDGKQYSQALLDNAARLHADLERLEQYLDHGWASAAARGPAPVALTAS